MSEQQSNPKYSVEELAQDVSFIRWVKAGQPQDESFEAIAVQSPESFSEAIRLVNDLSFLSDVPSQERMDKLQTALEKDLSNATRLSRRLPKWISAAAAVLLLLAGGAIWLCTPKVYHTKAGEQLAITLPDGSQVNLNGNSSLRVNRIWSADKTRKVKLRGEAFFSVEKTKTAQSFEVTAGRTKIDVLGTRFNVRQFGDKTNVVLNEGSVRIKDERQTQVVTKEMQPGQMVSLEGETAMDLSQVDTSLFTSWREGFYLLEETPLSSLIDILTHNYDQKVELTDPNDADRIITGRIPATDLEALLRAIELVLEVEIVQEPGKIVFQ